MNMRSTTRLFVSIAVLVVGTVLPFAMSAAPSVTSSVLDHIVVFPNDRPTIVDLGSDQQFLATGFSSENTELPNLTFSWTVDGGIGSIATNGIFTPTKGGIGTVIARNGQITASIGVVVRGRAVIANTNTNTVEPPLPTTTTTVKEVAQTTPGEASNTNTTIAPQESPNTAAATTTASTSCTTLRAWVWVVILLGYLLLSFVFYLSLGESTTIWWWVWPAGLTALLLILFNAVHCAEHQRWVPMAIVLLGILLGLFYARLLRPREFSRSN